MANTSLAPAASGRQQAKSITSAMASGTRRSRPSRQLANNHPGRAPRGTADEWLTVDEVCAELRIGRRTFERWRTLGVAPRATRSNRNSY
jgi:hypothetical protein